MNSDNKQMFENLVECIKMTQSGNLEAIKKGTSRLESQHQSVRFGPMLLQLLTQNAIPLEIKLGASIYFKNYVKQYWGRDEDIISTGDQDMIKQCIVRVMLQADKNSQRQLSEAITIITGHDFFEKWDKLLPELIDQLKAEKSFEKICGVLRIIESITCRYPEKEKNLEMITQIKYILELFQDIWLSMLSEWSRPIVAHFGVEANSKKSGPPTELVKGGDAAVRQMRYQILSVEQLVLIFFDLNSVDLIAFFENKMSVWAKAFEALLRTTDRFNVFSTSGDVPGPLDSVRTAIVRALKLFNSKYEEEYSKYVPTFVQHICGLLTTINDDERYDHLAAESIGYLSSVACQQWNASLFSEARILKDIVERILLRNIRLRASDVNMYEMNGEDWILRDMEGSDLYTRRRGAVDLVRGLLENFESEISVIIMSQIQALMHSYAQNPETNYLHKDTAINLILAVSVKGRTKLSGATKLNAHVPIMQFFQQHILPELLNSSVDGKQSHPIIISDCLKFVITFRSQWQNDNFLQLLPLACKFLGEEDYVVHTYAAIAIDKILAMKVYAENKQTSNKPTFKYPKAKVVSLIQKVLMALFTVLNTREESQTNEYVMKCIMRVIARAEEGTLSVIEPVIAQCSQMLMSVAKNPQKPLFNHYMFECMAALIRFVCDEHYIVDHQKTANKAYVAKFEAALMGPFVAILEMEQATEFHPYIYQMIGLMLRLRAEVNANYENLFDKLLETSLWNNDGNIVAISGTFADYLRLVDIATFIDERRLTGMLGIYQHLLSKRTQDFHAFRILAAIFQYVPMAKLHKYLKEIIELVCIRIRHKKSTALCCHFVVALATLIVKNATVAPLVAACDEVQPGIFAMLLEKVWLQFARHVTDLTDRKILTIGMLAICKDQRFKGDAQLRGLFPRIINCVVEIFEAGPLASDEHKTAEFYIQKLEDQGAGNKFVGLSFARSPPHDVTKGMEDPRLLLLRCLSDSLGNNQMRQQFAAQSKPVICKTINGYAAKFKVNFNLPVLQQ